MRYFYTAFDTEFGWMAAVASENGLRRLTVPQPSADKALKLIAELIPQSSANSAYFNDLSFRLQEYFEGNPMDFADKLDLRDSTPFQQDVYRTIGPIPYGETRTYGWVAAALGNPKGARGVGQALARNPIPIVVPCHRITASGGGLGGYSGGLETKRRLLDLESPSA